MTNVTLTVSGISISVIWWHIVLSLSQGSCECEQCEPPGMSSEYVLPKMVVLKLIFNSGTRDNNACGACNKYVSGVFGMRNDILEDI